MSKPKKFTILRGVENSYKTRVPLPKPPTQVWTLLSREKFDKVGLVHNESAFSESPLHDWRFENGFLLFYGHSGAAGELHDLVVVYE